MNGLSFSCGAQLQDSDLPDSVEEIVFVRKLACEDPIEKLYYSAQFEDIICVHCSGPVQPWSDNENVNVKHAKIRTKFLVPRRVGVCVCVCILAVVMLFVFY